MDLMFVGKMFYGIYEWLHSHSALWTTIEAVAFLHTFFALYVLAMGLYRAHLAGTMTRTGYILGWPWMAFAALVDLVANLTIFCLIFLEPPKELLVTARLKRHIAEGSGWRYRVARAICLNVLDYFDPSGKHC